MLIHFLLFYLVFQALVGGHLTHMTDPKSFCKSVTDFLLHITPPADIANLQQHTQMYGDM